jgi:chromate reductase
MTDKKIFWPSCEFSNKPAALITASSSGLKGHASLMNSLNIIKARITQETQLVISYAKVKISKKFRITHEANLIEVGNLIQSLNALMSQR